MKIPANVFLFNPHLTSTSWLKHHHRVMESIRARRGLQPQCVNCVKECKVLAVSSDLDFKFSCADAETKGLSCSKT